jgi:hypothetical protein
MSTEVSLNHGSNVILELHIALFLDWCHDDGIATGRR